MLNYIHIKIYIQKYMYAYILKYEVGHFIYDPLPICIWKGVTFGDVRQVPIKKTGHSHV